ncbi:hypothetical protein AB0C34_16565 [Nocardia sp. NPDC049220]
MAARLPPKTLREAHRKNDQATYGLCQLDVESSFLRPVRYPYGTSAAEG